MWEAKIVDDRVYIGERFAVSFQRTLRVPDDGYEYPLPPTLGLFAVRSVSDFQESLPSSWDKDGVFFCMYQREAMWMAFEAPPWKPCAIKIGIGKINALTGDNWDNMLKDSPQDYLVCPEQPWLDGINSGAGSIHQFVAMPLGEGYTIEGQITGQEEFGGIQLLVYDPKDGIFPDEPPPPPTSPGFFEAGPLAFSQATPSVEMGLGAGGKIQQKIYLDRYGIETWDQSDYGDLTVYILNSIYFQKFTGEPAPSTPVSAQTYTHYGLPWFKLYDEAKGALLGSELLAGTKTVKEIDAGKNLPQTDAEKPLNIDSDQIKTLKVEDEEKMDD